MRTCTLLVVVLAACSPPRDNSGSAPVVVVAAARPARASVHDDIHRAGRSERVGRCILQGEIVDADERGEIVLESAASDAQLQRVDALHVATCRRVPLGMYYQGEPPTITGSGTRAGLTREHGGNLHIVDTSTGAVVEIVPTPPCSIDRGCSFRTGTGGALQRNGRSVIWHGAVVWCEPLPGRPANACPPPVDDDSP